jgi:hypothetical protein
MNNHVLEKMQKENSGQLSRKYILDNYSREVIVEKMNKLFEVLQTNIAGTQLQNILSSYFTTNTDMSSINELKNIGHGTYSMRNNLFFIFPKWYLIIARNIYLMRTKIIKRFQ